MAFLFLDGKKIKEWEQAKKWYALGDYEKADEAFKRFADRWWSKLDKKEREVYLKYRKDCEAHLPTRGSTAQTQPTGTIFREKEIIREVVKIRCPHCRTVYDDKLETCPNCGSPNR